MQVKSVTEDCAVRLLTVIYDDMEFTYDVIRWELDDHNNLAFQQVVVGPGGRCSVEVTVVRKWREYSIGGDISISPVTVQVVENDNDEAGAGQ